MYSELDRLSAAWEALDRQLKSKVLDLTAMEDKLSKSAHDVRFPRPPCLTARFLIFLPAIES
jgi:hypothetical protein